MTKFPEPFIKNRTPPLEKNHIFYRCSQHKVPNIHWCKNIEYFCLLGLGIDRREYSILGATGGGLGEETLVGVGSVNSLLGLGFAGGESGILLQNKFTTLSAKTKNKNPNYK